MGFRRPSVRIAPPRPLLWARTRPPALCRGPLVLGPYP